MRWRLKSTASRLFTQPFIQTQIKENTKAPRHWPLCGEFTGDRWIPRTNGQWRGKCFHLMTSSWITKAYQLHRGNTSAAAAGLASKLATSQHINSHNTGIQFALLWHHNGHDSVSNHQPHHCLLNRLFGCKSKKTTKLRVTGLCAGNSPGTGEFPAQIASKAEKFLHLMTSSWSGHNSGPTRWGFKDLTYTGVWATLSWQISLHGLYNVFIFIINYSDVMRASWRLTSP